MVWRERGGGPVWPALTAVAKSLPGESEANARRLLNRLLNEESGWHDRFKRAGIDDLWKAAWERKTIRLMQRALRDYKDKVSAMLTQNPAPSGDPVNDYHCFCIPLLTTEEIVIRIQEAHAAKLLPFNIISRGCQYDLVFDDPYPLDTYLLLLRKLSSSNFLR